VELCELEDWNCCGATAAHSLDHRIAVDLAGRNLELAAGQGHDTLVAPCPLCFNRLKTAEHELLGEARDRYSVSIPSNSARIWDLANLLSQEEILERMTERVKRELGGLKAVCYYGCMASRPPKITGEGAYENPMSMDRILERLGVEVIQWSFKTDCCGAGHLVARPDIVYELAGRLYKGALRAGANCIAVSCQMCQANLDLHQDKILKDLGVEQRFPVLYFTELIGLALSHGDAAKWMKMHFVDPRGLISDACRITLP
jgi:heterodisulfide reductase subunit B